MTDTEKKPIIATINVKQEVPTERVMYVLENWFDNGGIDSWAQLQGRRLAPGTVLADYKKGGKLFPAGHEEFGMSVNAIVPTIEGAALLIGEDVEEDGKFSKQHELTLASIAKGLQVMHDKYPSHYGDFIGENDDVVTASIFIQCCLFGEEVYG